MTNASTKRIDKYVVSLHLAVNEGNIIDAGFVKVPRQRNSREENKQIKAAKIPERFEKNPHDKSHLKL